MAKRLVQTKDLLPLFAHDDFCEFLQFLQLLHTARQALVVGVAVYLRPFFRLGLFSL